MADLLEPGAGAGGALAALSDLWRSVYRKAAEVAEARTLALLNAHGYQDHGRRAIAVVIDGGGGFILPGPKCDLELPWQYQLEGWALYANTVGTITIELQRAATFDAFPTRTSVTPNPATRPGMVGNWKAQSEDTTDWVTPLARGTVLRVEVLTADALHLATLTLYVRAL